MNKIILNFIKIALISLFLSSSAFAEIISKTIVVDNISNIELNFDTATEILTLKFISNDIALFDEQYAEDSLIEAVEDCVREQDCSSATQRFSKLHYNVDNKYTVLEKAFKLE